MEYNVRQFNSHYGRTARLWLVWSIVWAGIGYGGLLPVVNSFIDILPLAIGRGIFIFTVAGAFGGPAGILFGFAFYKNQRQNSKFQKQKVRDGELYGEIKTRIGWDSAGGTADIGFTYVVKNITSVEINRRFLIVHGDVQKTKRTQETFFGIKTEDKTKISEHPFIKIPRTFTNEERIIALSPGTAKRV
jgi:hypothetical protein